MQTENNLKTYFIVATFSMVFAVIGFAYNAWRMEVTEDNSNIRAASFQVLIELAELEQIVFLAHYDQDLQTGNPRIGWVKVGIINDLSAFVSEDVANQAKGLRDIWSVNWQEMVKSERAVTAITESIDLVRKHVKVELSRLD